MTPEQKALDEIYELLCRLERQLGSQMTPEDARLLMPAIEACKWRKQPEHGERFGHFGQLREIFDGVLEMGPAEDGLLSTRFPDGTRLSFLCGEGGRLNGVVIQRGAVAAALPAGTGADHESQAR